MRRAKEATRTRRGRQRSVFLDGTCESGKEAPLSHRSRSRLSTEAMSESDAKEPLQRESSAAPLKQATSLPIQRVRRRSSLKGDKLRDVVSMSKLHQERAATRLQAAARGRIARKLKLARFAASEQKAAVGRLRQQLRAAAPGQGSSPQGGGPNAAKGVRNILRGQGSPPLFAPRQQQHRRTSVQC